MIRKSLHDLRSRLDSMKRENSESNERTHPHDHRWWYCEVNKFSLNNIVITNIIYYKRKYEHKGLPPEDYSAWSPPQANECNDKLTYWFRLWPTIQSDAVVDMITDTKSIIMMRARAETQSSKFPLNMTLIINSPRRELSMKSSTSGSLVDGQ